MIENLDIKTNKYKALSLLKETTLIINRNIIKTQTPIQSLFPEINNDKNLSVEVLKHLRSEMYAYIDKTDSILTPTNEHVNIYFDKVAEYIASSYYKKLNHTIYSPLVFSNWMWGVYNEKGVSLKTSIELSPHFIEIFKTEKNNFIVDIENILNFYKEGKIKRNTYEANVFDAIIGLFIFIFLDGKVKIAPFYSLTGNILLDNGLIKEAIVFFQKAIEIEKDYYTGYIGLADAYRYLNEYEEAIKQYLKAISIVNKYKQSDETPYFLDTYNSDTSYYTDCFYSLSLCYANLNQFENSILYIDKAIEEKDTIHIGHKIDKFESLVSVKKYILNLYSKYEKNNDINELDFTKFDLDPKIHQVLKNLYDNNHFSMNHKNWETLSTTSLIILKNINFFETFFNVTEPDDYSPLTSQYFKIMEIELYDKILKKIEVWLLNKSISTLNLRSDIYYNNKFKKVTLASYSYIFSEPSIKDFLIDIYPHYYDFLSSNLIRIIDKLLIVRNGTAHRSLTTKQKHQEIKGIIVDNKIFDKLCEL